MSVINRLDQETVAKIAAGEVVERPASVVKELVENSLDAGATRIEIEIRNGGRSLIRVTDNGCGMDRDDLLLALERHATSKLRRIEDLDSLSTLGFRGEALSSIAAVSNLEIKTRLRGDESGHILEVRGGTTKPPRQAGLPEGTTVLVTELFANIPARLKFLKSIPTEAGYIAEIVGRLAVANPEVSFRLIHHEYEILFTPGSGDRLEAVTAVYGREIAREILPIPPERGDGISIEGFLGKPSIARTTRHYQLVFLNGRSIRSRTVGAAVEKAYHSLLPIARYPFAVIMLTMDPSAFDVNVHPAKLEVRFGDESAVFRLVHQATRRALAGASLLYGWPEQPEAKSAAFQAAPGKAVQTARVAGKMPVSLTPVIQPLLSPEESKYAVREHAFVSLGLALNATYILARDDEGLLLIDQHAAHERILFERFVKHAERTLSPQRLLLPITLELSAPRAKLLAERLEQMGGIGLQIEPFGPRTFVLRTMPSALIKMDGAGLVQDLLDQSLENLNVRDPKAIRESLLVTAACRAAIKAGDHLTPPEIQALLDDLAATENRFTCPHGRPTAIRLTWEEIDRRFGRK